MATSQVNVTVVPTRFKTSIWLIGQPQESLPQNILPTTSDVLKTFFHFHTKMKQTVSESLKTTTEQLLLIWNKAHILTAFLPNIISKMKSVVDEYNLRKKNKARKSESQQSREEIFRNKWNYFLMLLTNRQNK